MLGIDEQGTIEDVAFTGRGCAISQASASMLPDEIKGKSLDEISHMGKADVLDNLASRSARHV